MLFLGFAIYQIWQNLESVRQKTLINQENLIKSVQNLDREIFLTGDFNLGINTNTLEILEYGLNLRNLIQGNKINSTSKLYQKPNKFANYTLVSKWFKNPKIWSYL